MRIQHIAIAIVSLFLFSACVGKKKYLELQSQQTAIQVMLEETKSKLDTCEDERTDLQGKIKGMESDLNLKDEKIALKEQQIQTLEKTNTNLLERLSDLSIVSKAGAESIQKSLEAINQQGKYIQDLNSTIKAKDSLNLALVMNLKRSLEDVNDEDISVEVKKGVVYVSLSDKMLFKSGSAVISSRAGEVLGKVAKVINDHKGLDILVEGHTDNVPINTDCIQDNWALSTQRAAAVVRFLHTNYNVEPARLTAGGRSSYLPKATNDTAEGRSANRRTEIIILPKLDQFFQLLEPGKG